MYILKQDLQKVFEIFMGQLRQLFGLKSDSLYVGASGTIIFWPVKKAVQNGEKSWSIHFQAL